MDSRLCVVCIEMEGTMPLLKRLINCFDFNEKLSLIPYRFTVPS